MSFSNSFANRYNSSLFFFMFAFVLNDWIMFMDVCNSIFFLLETFPPNSLFNRFSSEKKYISIASLSSLLLSNELFISWTYFWADNSFSGLFLQHFFDNFSVSFIKFFRSSASEWVKSWARTSNFGRQPGSVKGRPALPKDWK